ncbi:MAG: energy-coupling factor transporter transmembrane component T family protein [Chloroflexota bacterium]
MSMARATFDFYVPGRSLTHRIDPRVKLGLVVGLSVLTVIWVNLPLLLSLLFVTHLVLLASRYPARRLGLIWRALIPLLAVVIIVWPLFDRSGSALFSIGPIDITTTGVLRGFATALRLATVSFLFVIWMGTTDIRMLVRSFVRLGLPDRWGMAITIGLRFIPTFTGMYQTVYDAQRSRGLILEGNILKRARQMIPILVAALVSAIRASEQLAMTLDSRAFGARSPRTALHDLRMQMVDWLVLIVGGGIIVGLFAVSLIAGFGSDLIAL